MDDTMLQLEADLSAHVSIAMRDVSALTLLAVLSKVAGRLTVKAQHQGCSSDQINEVMDQNRAAGARVAIAMATARHNVKFLRSTPTKEKAK
ncbi:hypothetical protein [Oceaniglobus trochenteri]|uniref:hypothetical protein n=1 Tax=Oceaniglobus trochenteri TaxID=2763260 RepID=UPI001CFF839D|nr:hypothetical protein [Oceaniglobus trochenteri]